MRRDLRIRTWLEFDGKTWGAILREYVRSKNKRTGRPFTKFIGFIPVPGPSGNGLFNSRDEALKAAQAVRERLTA